MIKHKDSKYFMWGVISLIAIWISSGIFLVILIPKSEARGQFGDMFGAINSLFSGFALCGVVYSIILQNNANKFSQYQFRFNHILDIVNNQVDIFNSRIIEFQFTDVINRLVI